MTTDVNSVSAMVTESIKLIAIIPLAEETANSPTMMNHVHPFVLYRLLWSNGETDLHYKQRATENFR